MNKEFGQLIKLIRTFCGVGRPELAEKLGRPLSYVAGVETGNRLLALEDLQKIADALGLPDPIGVLEHEWKRALSAVLTGESKAEGAH